MTLRRSLRARSSLTLSCFFAVSAALFAACGSDGTTPGTGGSAGEGGDGSSSAGRTGSGGDPSEGGMGATSGSGGSNDAGAGGGPNDAGAGGGGPGGDPAVQAYFDALSSWPDVPPASDTPSGPTTVTRDLTTAKGGVQRFSCKLVTHDIVEERDEILNFDSAAEYVKPGVILSGSDFADGELIPIPLPRSPITLSIDVPGVEEPTIRVQNPTVANVQQGIATLQARAEEATTGSYAAKLAYEQHSVQSVEEMAYKLGVSASFDAAFASGSFSTAFENASSEEKYTVYSKLMQTMYTISFSHDSFETARDFFSSSLSMDQVETAEEAGYLAADNPPVFIGSVTYGRMVVFTATSTQASSTQNLEAQLNAAGVNWKGETALTAEQKSFMNSLDIEVLSVGGNQADVSNAIRTGEWSLLYAGADILNSVPLRYTVRSLTGVRPVAAIGDTTQFTVADCDPAEPWTKFGPDGVVFSSISSNPQNNPVYAIGVLNGERRAYKFQNSQFTVVGSDPLDETNVAVDNAGNAFIQHVGVIWKLSAAGGGWANTGLNAGFLEFDAGAANWLAALSGTYSTNQNDIYITDGAVSWMNPVDEAQLVKINQPNWITAVDKSWIGRWGGELMRHDLAAGTFAPMSNKTANLDTVSKFSAASASELYAVSTAGTQILAFNDTSDMFEDYVGGPAGHTIKDLEAVAANDSLSNRFWVVTTAGKIYSYTPQPQ